MSTEKKTLEERIDLLSKKLDDVAIIPSPYYGASSALESRDDEIDLRELLVAVWKGKLIVAATALICALASVVYALSIPNTYRSEALLAPVGESAPGGLAKMAGQLGGLASLAGVNLGDSSQDKVAMALAVLTSRKFVDYYIARHQILVPLMAAENWNMSSNILVINQELYDVERQEWVRETSRNKTPEPSAQEAYKAFRNLLHVSQNKETGLLTLSIEFYSPVVAKQWVEWLIEDINLELKTRDIEEAKRSIAFLNIQLAKTSVSEMQAVFYQLVEDQTKTMMFAEAREQYAFQTIDPPVVPERKSGPKRAFLVIFSVIFGIFIGCLLAIIWSFYKNSANKRAINND